MEGSDRNYFTSHSHAQPNRVLERSGIRVTFLRLIIYAHDTTPSSTNMSPALYYRFSPYHILLSTNLHLKQHDSTAFTFYLTLNTTTIINNASKEGTSRQWQHSFPSCLPCKPRRVTQMDWNCCDDGHSWYRVPSCWKNCVSLTCDSSLFSFNHSLITSILQSTKVQEDRRHFW